MKVMTVVGTRPELIKLSRVIPALDNAFDHVLVHTGQNYDYELNRVFFDQLTLRLPDEFLEAAHGSAAETIAAVIARTDAALAKHQPDAFLVLGDTNSCYSVLAAKRRWIPSFHMEAGNRCFDLRVPEEINRRVIDNLSDVNLVYTEHARRYLLEEGFRGDRVVKTGSPMKEVLDYYSDGVEASMILQELGVEDQEYFVISAHREENVDDPLRLHKLISAIKQLSSVYGLPIVFSVHPRTRARLLHAGISDLGSNIKLIKPLGFLDYVSLQRSALCVLSDSGTLTEEAALLGFPAVTMREAHERPEGTDKGVLVMSGLDASTIIAAVRIATQTRKQPIPEDYLVDNVSETVVRTIVSYTAQINRTNWYKM